MQESSSERRERLIKEYGFQDSIIEMYVSDNVIGGFFAKISKTLTKEKELIKLASNYITSDLTALMKTHSAGLGKVTPESFVTLLRMVESGELSSRGAKDTLAIMYRDGGDAKHIAEKQGLIQKSDLGSIEEIVKQIIALHPIVVAEYTAGKVASLQFLVGQGMKMSKGSANPAMLSEMFRKLLN